MLLSNKHCIKLACRKWVFDFCLYIISLEGLKFEFTCGPLFEKWAENGNTFFEWIYFHSSAHTYISIISWHYSISSRKRFLSVGVIGTIQYTYTIPQGSGYTCSSRMIINYFRSIINELFYCSVLCFVCRYLAT